MDSGQGSAQTKQAKKSKKWPKVLLAVVLVASLAGNAFLAYQVATTQSQKVGSVCGDEYIEKINTLTSSNESNTDSLKQLYSDVKSLKNYEKDPNCQSILFISSFVSGMTNEYKQAYNSILDLNKQGQNASIKINFSMTYQSLKSMVEFDGSVKNIITSEPSAKE